MKPDKHFDSKSSTLPAEESIAWSDAAAEEEPWLSSQQSHLRMMLRRAVVVYFVLFLSLGLLMSFVGIDPLARGGLMPKLLLLFIGLSLLIAVANSLVDASREHSESWFKMLGRLITFKARRR